MDELRMHAIGNDVIDLHHPSILEHSSQDEEWMQRHLTEEEWRWLAVFPDDQRLLSFWKIFAVKEASSKAITQMGYTVPFGSFTHFDVDLYHNIIMHCSGEVLCIQNIQFNSEWIHAVVSSTPSAKVIFEVHRVTDNVDASEYVMEKLLINVKLNGHPSVTLTKKDGIPLLVKNGKSVAPVSFSHSGRFAAFSWLNS